MIILNMFFLILMIVIIILSGGHLIVNKYIQKSIFLIILTFLYVILSGFLFGILLSEYLTFFVLK